MNKIRLLFFGNFIAYIFIALSFGATVPIDLQTIIINTVLEDAENTNLTSKWQTQYGSFMRDQDSQAGNYALIWAVPFYTNEKSDFHLTYKLKKTVQNLTGFKQLNYYIKSNAIEPNLKSKICLAWFPFRCIAAFFYQRICDGNH